MHYSFQCPAGTVARTATKAGCAHLDAAMNRTIAQMKIVAVIPGPRSIAPYLSRVAE